jgi:type I restriction enzyme S subunit
MSPYPQKPLSEVSTIFSGYAFKSKDMVSDGDIPIIKIANIQNRLVRPDCVTSVPKKLYSEKLSKYVLRPDDVLIAMTGAGSVGNIGKMRRVEKTFLVNQRVGIIRVNTDLADPEFVYQVLSNEDVENNYYQLGLGAGQPNLSPQMIGSLRIPLPPLPIQRKFADVLSAYDDLIEVNTRRIRILEEMAQSVYREWFGKVDGRGGAASLPEGWEIKPFSAMVDIDPATSVDKQIEKPFVGMNALSTNSMLIDLDLVETRTGSSGAKFQNRDVLFPRITPSVENGKAGFVQFLKDGQVSIGSTEIIVFREKELVAEFIYFLSREHEFRGNAINSMIGASGRQRVQQGCFDTFLVAKPPKELQQKFAEIVSPMFKITHTLALKNANLRRTRDLLLPRLVRGEVLIG